VRRRRRQHHGVKSGRRAGPLSQGLTSRPRSAMINDCEDPLRRHRPRFVRKLMAMHAARYLVVMSALALSACALPGAPPRDETVKQGAPNLTLPPQWVAAPGRQGAVADNWLASWNDPSLSALVAEGLAYNTDLRLAATRIESAEAYLR